jgi:hypothetical protein
VLIFYISYDLDLIFRLFALSPLYCNTKKYILEFLGRIFRLRDPSISEDLKEAYNLHTISLEQYAAELDKEEAHC